MRKAAKFLLDHDSREENSCSPAIGNKKNCAYGTLSLAVAVTAISS